VGRGHNAWQADRAEKKRREAQIEIAVHHFPLAGYTRPLKARRPRFLLV
jgi:hypothetical protein